LLAAYLLLLAPACSAFDNDVYPQVTGATIALHRAQPAQPADINVEVQVRGRLFANHTITILGADLYESGVSGPVAHLALAWPANVDPHFDGTDDRTVPLIDLGTPNALLSGYCGQPLNIVVRMGYLDDPDTNTFSVPAPVTLICN
jgi:hypothetical protein